jgi:hypothetical protein
VKSTPKVTQRELFNLPITEELWFSSLLPIKGTVREDNYSSLTLCVLSLTSPLGFLQREGERQRGMGRERSVERETRERKMGREG